MLKVIIENANSLNIDDILEISKECFSVPWSRKSVQNEFENNPAFYLIAKVDEKIVGFGGYWVIFDEAHITNIAVLPSYRRLSIGSIILEAMIQNAKSKGVVDMTLEVRKGNIKALKLYSKHNFKEEGRRPDYYSDPKEDALIMWNRNI